MKPPGPLSHIALVVRDAARTAQFLADLFGEGVRVRHDAGGSDETCVRLGNVLLVLAEADVERPLLGDHLAFTVSPHALRAHAARLTELARAHQMARHDTALYFADFDHHVFELECVGMDAGPAGR